MKDIQIKKLHKALTATFVIAFLAGVIALPAGLAHADDVGGDFGLPDIGGWEDIGSGTDYSPIYGGTDYSPLYGGTDYSPSYSGGSDYTPSYGGGYDSYTPSSYSSYVPSSSYSSYTPSSYPTYQYTPSSSYSPSNASSYSSASTAPQWQYVSSTNTNTNNNQSSAWSNSSTSNSSNNNIVNNNNPVNTNDINLVVLSGAAPTSQTQQNAIDGSCVISPSTTYVNQSVTFSANATGGNGNYTYQWSGDNGISSNSQSFTGYYSYSGVKNATVAISSNGQTITRSCSVNVQDTYNNNGNLGVSCVANPSNAAAGQTVTWTAYVSNNINNGNYYNSGYSYQWSGSDNLYGSGQSISHAYYTTGYQTANVSVYANGQTYSASCSTNVNGSTVGGATVIRNNTPTSGTPVSGVFLSQVPATGISLSLKFALFAIGLFAWSLFAAYFVSSKRKNKLAAAGIGSVGSAAGSNSVAARIAAFKAANMQKKGISA